MFRAVGSVAGLGLLSYSWKRLKAETLPWQTGDSQGPVSLDYSWLLGDKTGGDGGVSIQKKVMVLGYPRTGSTLLGELLAAHPNTSYFMEPLFATMSVGQLDWDYVLEGKIETGEVPREAVTCLMEGIYSCNETVIEKLEDWSRVPHSSVSSVPASICRSSASLLTKVVRLHEPGVREVASKVPDLQVVHIVRDPRAVAASIQAQQVEWGERSADTYCRHLLADMSLETHLGPERYMRVRYEDLVESPITVLDRIAAFTGVPVTEEMKEAVAVKMLGKSGRKNAPLTDSQTADYYSTVRGPGHRHDAWRTRLSNKDIVLLECGDCGLVMDKLGYQKVGSEE